MRAKRVELGLGFGVYSAKEGSKAVLRYIILQMLQGMQYASSKMKRP